MQQLLGGNVQDKELEALCPQFPERADHIAIVRKLDGLQGELLIQESSRAVGVADADLPAVNPLVFDGQVEIGKLGPWLFQ